ncbi:PoNe immunity protein domain-containing protein [Acanthopleuribacter pedis]|uniref:DUF1911 domain-containing protein n=1 Tax=Acanthopleuribacter pedis TaxID=442870 RepID=A0A8J7QEP4_9BACT|nr:PoNe immunity protein domain-containing protein [Acanthopleuribacter pedis]MBO1323262.1 DUF1911 domain-containing protein [Acanthopleuribacter pedis]
MSKTRAIAYGTDYFSRNISELSRQVLEDNQPAENKGDDTRQWLTARLKLLICRFSSGESIDSLRAAFAATISYITEEESREPLAFFDLDQFDDYYLAVSAAAWCTLTQLPAKHRTKLVTMYQRRYPEPADRDPLLDRLLIGNTTNSASRLRHKNYFPLLDAWNREDKQKAEYILAAYLCQLDRRLGKLSWQQDPWSDKAVGIGLWCFVTAVIVSQRGLDPGAVSGLPTFPADWLTQASA